MSWINTRLSLRSSISNCGEGAYGITGVVVNVVVDDGAASAASTKKAQISTSLVLPQLSGDSRRWRLELPECSLVISSSSSSSTSPSSSVRSLLPSSSRSVSDPRHDECERARMVVVVVVRGTGEPLCGAQPEDDGVVLGSTRLRAFHNPRGRLRPRRASRGHVPAATVGGGGASMLEELIIREGEGGTEGGEYMRFRQAISSGGNLKYIRLHVLAHRALSPPSSRVKWLSVFPLAQTLA